jgi:twitching motility protein PilT
MKTIEALLEHSIKHKASDLHIMPGLPPMLRVDGKLIRQDNLPALTPEQTKTYLYHTMSIEQQEKFEHKLVLDFAVSYPKIGNFRVSALHQLHGVAGVFRIIPERVPSFDELGLPPVLKALLSLSHGLILVTGPTGSGKSTTMASMLDYVNVSQSTHIITIEDPIEYIHLNKRSAINQLQVGRDTPDVDTALRSSLRQDPNIIQIGELRDLETIRLALTAAETGHLVISTMHASSAPLAVSRIVDIFPTQEKNRVRNALAETLQAVICQELVNRINGGRVAAFEIMLATPAIRHLIRQDMTSNMDSTIQTSGDVGMCTMEQYLNSLAAKRLITTQTARSVVANRGSFIS